MGDQFWTVAAAVFLLALPLQIYSDQQLPTSSHTLFPKGFRFGAASSAYQTEGAWNEDGKGPSIWDSIAHVNPQFIYGKANGDVSDDSYHKFKEDVELLNHIGLQVYRLSISWSRVLPRGTTDYVNLKGVMYYSDFIDELLAKGITPMVTLYHWDLPETLSSLGGWLSSEIVDYFIAYVDFVFKTFGSRVKLWITFNEAHYLAMGYGSNNLAPALSQLHGVGEYLAAHNVLLAHGKTYRLYERKYKAEQAGKISMAFVGYTCEPLTNSEEDVAAAKRCFTFSWGWFANPIFNGDYHPDMRAAIDKNSRSEGRSKSRLPYFTDEEIKMMKGTADFFGANHYILYKAKPGVSGVNPSLPRDMAVEFVLPPNCCSPFLTYVSVDPKSIRVVVNQIKEEYGNVEIMITENGFPELSSSETHDPQRVIFFEGFLAELRKAIYEDKCNVTGYTTWSLLDAFEWTDGYRIEFGIVDVDVNSRNKTRRMKTSAHWLKNYIAMHKLLYPEGSSHQ